MSWSEQEEKLKSKLLNYTEEVNNENIWNALVQRKKQERKFVLLPILITALGCIVLSALLTTFLLNEKNNLIECLNNKINEQESIIKECSQKIDIIANNTNPLPRGANNHKIFNVSSKYNNNSPHQTNTNSTRLDHVILRSSIVDEAIPDKLLTPSTNIGLNKTSSNTKESSLSVLSPIDIVLQKIKYDSNKLKISQTLTQTIKQPKCSYYVSLLGGLPLVFEQGLSSENTKTSSFTPVLANSISLGIEKKFSNKLCLSGELMYTQIVSKLNYNFTKINQIYINDTSIITIDPVGNNTVEVENVLATKIISKKGDAYNVTNTLGLNFSLMYTIQPKLRGSIGLGYSLWQKNRGINSETYEKFNTQDKGFGYKIFYTVGLEYRLYKALSLNIHCHYAKTQYALNTQIYHRKYITPIIGVSYWIR